MKTVLLRTPLSSSPTTNEVTAPSGGARPRSLPLVLKPPPSDRYRAFSEAKLDQIPQVASLPEEQRHAMRVVSRILPFRVNGYVIDQLIDWSRVPDDPIFQMTFPQRGMLRAVVDDFLAKFEVWRDAYDAALTRDAANGDIRRVLGTRTSEAVLRVLSWMKLVVADSSQTCKIRVHCERYGASPQVYPQIFV